MSVLGKMLSTAISRKPARRFGEGLVFRLIGDHDFLTVCAFTAAGLLLSLRIATAFPPPDYMTEMLAKLL